MLLLLNWGAGFLKKFIKRHLNLNFKHLVFPMNVKLNSIFFIKVKRFNKSISQILFAMIRLSLN